MPLSIPEATLLEPRDTPEGVARVLLVGTPLLGRRRLLSAPLLPPLLSWLLVVNDTRLVPLLRRAASPCASLAEELELSAASSDGPLIAFLVRNGRVPGLERDRGGVLLVGERRTPKAPPAEARPGLVPESPSPSSSLSVEDETGPREGRGLGAVSPVDDCSPLLLMPLQLSLQLQLLETLSSLVALLLGEPGQSGPQVRWQGFRGGLT